MKRFFKAFVYSFQGLKYATKLEPNFQFELVCCVAVIVLGFVFDITAIEWMMCILCMAAVLVSELINTAIETLTNLVSPQYHELAKITKDVASAAVLVAAICSAAVGLIIFVPYFIQWFTT